jgi:hypothetical protein
MSGSAAHLHVDINPVEVERFIHGNGQPKLEHCRLYRIEQP